MRPITRIALDRQMWRDWRQSLAPNEDASIQIVARELAVTVGWKSVQESQFCPERANGDQTDRHVRSDPNWMRLGCDGSFKHPNFSISN